MAAKKVKRVSDDVENVQSTVSAGDTVNAEGDLLWDKIKDMRIQMFGLPNQHVSDHVQKLFASGDKLAVKLKSPAVITSLESLLNPDVHKLQYELSPQEGFLVIRKIKPEFDV